MSAVLALDTILNDAKKEGVVFWTRSQMKTEGTVFQTHSQMQIPRCKVPVLIETRSTTIGLLHTWLTESISNADLHAWEHFQYWFAKTPWEWFLTLLEKLSENFFLDFTWRVGCFTAQLYSSAAPLQKSWHWPWSRFPGCFQIGCWWSWLTVALMCVAQLDYSLYP